MTKMSKTLFAIGAAMSGAVALAGPVGAQTGPGIACPIANYPSGFTDNQINASVIPIGETRGADCWTGNTYATGTTRARGFVTRLSNGGIGLRAYLFGAASPDSQGIQHKSARVQGFTSQGLHPTCYRADATPDGQPSPPNGSPPQQLNACSGIQNFRVVAYY